MNIALITPWYIDKNSIGGTERFTEDLAISLKEAGVHTSWKNVIGINMI